MRSSLATFQKAFGEGIMGCQNPEEASPVDPAEFGQFNDHLII